MPPMDYLLTRRSVSVQALVPPAPDEAQLEQILTAATRVPDHGKLCPWRILVLGKEGLDVVLPERFNQTSFKHILVEIYLIQYLFALLPSQVWINHD